MSNTNENENKSYIEGIGGFFFRSQNPASLIEWDIETLGIVITDYVWQQKTGPTVFEPFSNDTDYFREDKQWMLNFRVNHLKNLIVELRSKDLTVEERDEWNTPEAGSFARIHDPEGNPIELWEPPA